jgi:hypothetical protein
VHFAGSFCHYFSIYTLCAAPRKQNKIAHYGDSQPQPAVWHLPFVFSICNLQLPNEKKAAVCHLAFG